MTEDSRAALPVTRVLVVDSDPEYRLLVRSQLEAAGCEVHEAGDGREGLTVCRAANPSVVLLDAWLPVMTGAEFLRHQQADARIMDIPVIVISTDAIGPAMGIVRQLRKPVAPEVLLPIIRAVVGAARWQHT